MEITREKTVGISPTTFSDLLDYVCKQLQSEHLF